MSPKKNITYLLTILHILYISYLWLTYFAMGSLCLLISITYLFPPCTPLSSGNHLFVLCIYYSVSVLFIHLFCFWDSTYNKIIQHFSFFLDISSSIIPSRSIHVAASSKISSFFLPHISLSMYTTFFLSIYLPTGTWVTSIFCQL